MKWSHIVVTAALLVLSAAFLAWSWPTGVAGAQPFVRSGDTCMRAIRADLHVPRQGDIPAQEVQLSGYMRVPCPPKPPSTPRSVLHEVPAAGEGSARRGW